MRNKAKVKSSGPAPMEMIIKINNENVVLEVIPPAGMIAQETDPEPDPELDPLTPQNGQELPEQDEKEQDFAEDGDQDGIPSDDRKLWHNNSEKMRRAELRSTMERLKLLVPLEDSNQKYTTVNLLRRAKQLILKLEEKQKKNVTFRDQLLKEQKYLRKRLDSLQLEAKGQGGQPVGAPAFQKTLISTGAPSSASKYPGNLPLSQSAPPMILKRSKVSEVNNSEVILIDGPRVTSSRVPASVANPTAVFATVPMANSQTTYQVVGTTDQFVSDNFCFILDTSALD